MPDPLVRSISVFFVSLAVFLGQASPAKAQNNAIWITQDVYQRLAAIPNFDAYDVRGACYFPPQGGYQVGQVDGNWFIPLDEYYREIDQKIKRMTSCIERHPERRNTRLRRKRAALERVRADLNSGAKACGAMIDEPQPEEPTQRQPDPEPTPVPTIIKEPVDDETDIPLLEEWERQMTAFGKQHCDFLRGNNGFDPELAATYYDAEWVFYQIADYTGDRYWNDCAQLAESVYRDQYVRPNNGLVPGYWNFTHGLMQDYFRTGDDQSRQAALAIAKNAAYSVDGTPLSETAHVDFSREVAYAIMGYLNAESLGAPRRQRLGQLVEQAFDHMDQWFGRQSAPYVRPFMVALTAHALISYDEQVGDSRVMPTVTAALDILWDTTWNASAQAFQYTDRGDTSPAPDLNMLIAPAYAWAYYKTGDIRYRDRGDQIFAGGVRGAWLGAGKQFNQNYRWSFDYIGWRYRD